MIVHYNFDLTDYNSYKIKAICSKVYFPETEEDIALLFRDTSEKKILLGGGYNVILSKKHYKEPFIIFNEHFSKITVAGNRISAQAGASLYDLSLIALEHSLTGLEIFYDIPSSLGGAIVMNAGASGEDLKGLLLHVRYFDPVKLSFHEKMGVEIGFEYRNSFFQKNPHLIITSATLELKQGKVEEISAKMENTRAARWSKQPKEYPNAGSVFKRPPGRYVGPMIEELGLKGFTLGGAKVSEKHAGFIINFNQASGEDILNLINHVKQMVHEHFDVDLEIEQRII